MGLSVSFLMRAIHILMTFNQKEVVRKWNTKVMHGSQPNINV